MAVRRDGREINVLKPLMHARPVELFWARQPADACAPGSGIAGEYTTTLCKRADTTTCRLLGREAAVRLKQPRSQRCLVCWWSTRRWGP